MNCCDDYGRCVQTGNCPARAATPPAPRATMTCDERGVCNGTGNCPGCALPIIEATANPFQPAGREGGNFWIHSDPAPAEQLTLADVAWAFVWLLVCGGALAAVLGFATGLTWSLWP